MTVRLLLQLYSAFFRIGLFTFGGGYAMLPLIQKEIVEKYKWATDEDIMNYYAIGQMTPGIIAINTATFVGSKQGKIPGAIAATLGMVTPSLIIIIVIAKFLALFDQNIYVQKAFTGIRVMVIALILYAIINMGKKVIKDILDLILVIVSLALLLFADISPIPVIIGAAVIGIIKKSIQGE